MRPELPHTFKSFPLERGAVTVGASSNLTVGGKTELIVVLEDRQQTTITDLSVELSIDCWTGDSVTNIRLSQATFGTVSVSEGLQETVRQPIAVPQSTPFGCGPTVCTMNLILTVDGSPSSREFYVNPLTTPSVVNVIDPLLKLDYVVNDSFAVVDRTDADRRVAQSVRFAPTDDTPTTEPVDVFVRSVSDGLHAAPTVGHEPRTPVSELPDPVLVTEDDGDDRLVDAVEQL